MKYTLHNRRGSGGFAVQATLVAAGIDFDYAPMKSVPGEPLEGTMGGLNPWGQVPVLALQDGTRLTETAAILAHLAMAEPRVARGPTLWVDNPPLLLRWCVFLAVNAYEGILRRSYTDRYCGDIGAQAGAIVRAAANARVHAAFKCIEAETAAHRYLLSDRLSPCEIFLAMLYAWHNQKPDLPKCTWITRQVATHDLIRPIWEENFHDRLDFKWHEL